jgi:hypothetical protein
MAATKYWIRNASTGVYAQVEGTAERDKWAAEGWLPAEEEPGDQDKVRLYNAEIDGYAELAKNAADGWWSGVGWTYGPPPPLVDLTKDARLRDQPAPKKAAKQDESASAPASGEPKGK